MVRLLRREADDRRSASVQREMEQAESSINSQWMDVIDRLQHRIVHEYSMSEGPFGHISVDDLRLAALRHPEIAFWVKHNRARQGMLRVGDVSPNVSVLIAADGHSTMLLTDETKPVVVIAGSWS
jgi:predicted ATPase